MITVGPQPDGLAALQPAGLRQGEEDVNDGVLGVEVGVDVGTATAEVGQELRDALDVLLRRAQQTGAVRKDLLVQDLISLVVGASHAAQHLAVDPPAQRRVIMVILDGLRPAV